MKLKIVGGVDHKPTGGAFIARQPNGLYCRFSYVTESLTHINMTKEDYLNNFTGNVPDRSEAENILAHHVEDFSRVRRSISELNTTRAEQTRLWTHVTLPQNSIFVYKQKV